MSEPFIGEIRAFTYTFAPAGWLYCDGQTLPIAPYQYLYAVIGNTYGGSQASRTFALPDLRARVAVGAGTGPGLTPCSLNAAGGTATVTLDLASMPAHSHLVNAIARNDPDDTADPTGAYVAAEQPTKAFTTDDQAPIVALNAQTIASNGGNGAHENRQPFLGVSYCIAVEGIFPVSD